jgi:hypothetical protein
LATDDVQIAAVAADDQELCISVSLQPTAHANDAGSCHSRVAVERSAAHLEFYCIPGKPGTLMVAGVVPDGVESVSIEDNGRELASTPVENNAYRLTAPVGADTLVFGERRQRLRSGPPC